MATNEYQPTEDDLEYYIGFNLKMLSLIGFKCSLEKNEKHFGLANKLPTLLMCVHGIIIITLENYFMQDIWSSDKSLAIQILSQLVSNVQLIAKGFLLGIAIEQIQRVFQEIQILWKTYRPSTDKRKKILLDAHRTCLLVKIYIIVILSCIVCYFLCFLPSLFNLAQEYFVRKTNNYTYDFSERILLLKYPFEIPNIPTYLLLVLQEGLYLSITGINFWFNSDTLFAQSITHICLQFKILKYDIEVTFNNDNMRVSHLSLVTFVKRHRDLLRVCALIEEVFSRIIFSTMLFSSLNLCVNVIGMQGTIANKNYQETAIYLSILLNIILHILFYCTFAEKISEETRSLADTVYNCKWTTMDYKLRFYIQLIIMRSQKPFRCTAYGFFSIGHLQLTSILSTAYSYFMMLQTMNLN